MLWANLSQTLIKLSQIEPENVVYIKKISDSMLATMAQIFCSTRSLVEDFVVAEK